MCLGALPQVTSSVPQSLGGVTSMRGRFAFLSLSLSIKIGRDREQLCGHLLIEVQVRQSPAMSRPLAKCC